MAMFGFTFRIVKLILEMLNLFWHIWLLCNRIILLLKIDSNLKIEIKVFYFKIDFHVKNHCSIHFYIDMCKHKSFLVQFNFLKLIKSKSIFIFVKLIIHTSTTFPLFQKQYKMENKGLSLFQIQRN